MEIIKHKTISIMIDIKTDHKERAEKLDAEINSFIDTIREKMKNKNYNNFKIFEKSIENYYWEDTKTRSIVYLISFFYSFN